MDKKEIFNKVGGIINELNEQYDYLSKNPDSLNELELELFSANSNFLSDHISILVKINRKTDPFQKPSTLDPFLNANLKPDTEEEALAVADEPDVKFDLEKESELTFEFEEKEAEKLLDRPLTDDGQSEEEPLEDEEETGTRVAESQTEKVDQATENKPQDAIIKEVVISERTIAVPNDQIPDDNPVPTVNDLLAKNLPQQTLSSQFNSRQTKDLKGMISLNDKLLFVRDLFNGYSLAYSEAIELLNRFDSFESADNFLKQNYSSKNRWGDKQEVADKFYEVLNRRFAK